MDIFLKYINYQNLENLFSIYYGISFEDRSEQQLCKILLSELVDAKKHVHSAPSIAVIEN